MATKAELEKQIENLKAMHREKSRQCMVLRGRITWLCHLLGIAAEGLAANGAPETARLCRLAAIKTRGAGGLGADTDGEPRRF